MKKKKVKWIQDDWTLKVGSCFQKWLNNNAFGVKRKAGCCYADVKYPEKV
jgi:hypothetical protein